MTELQDMTKKEARQELIDQMNKIVYEKNKNALNNYRRQRKLWLNGRAVQPAEPWLLKEYSHRRLDQAVFTARQKGGYQELLEAAGF